MWFSEVLLFICGQSVVFCCWVVFLVFIRWVLVMVIEGVFCRVLVMRVFNWVLLQIVYYWLFGQVVCMVVVVRVWLVWQWLMDLGLVCVLRLLKEVQLVMSVVVNMVVEIVVVCCYGWVGCLDCSVGLGVCWLGRDEFLFICVESGVND